MLKDMVACYTRYLHGLCIILYINILLNLSLETHCQSPVNHFGKISAQPHPTLCIQFLDRENNDKNNTLPLGKQICLTIVPGCAEILPVSAAIPNKFNVQRFNH